MLPARLLATLLAILLLASTAEAAPTASNAPPTGLRAFLFRADEPLKREFARTPAFAWRPVAGARRYEFELSTSNVFRENGLIYANRSLKTPVAAVTMTLPWITGEPYSLYARVRAVHANGRTTRWSAAFGFNMRQANVPKPMTSYPGLLRWTPVDGADGYEVWLIDVPKSVVVFTNVLDEREFYTLHQGTAWISKVRWRIRTLRIDRSGENNAFRANGLPVTQYGPWSPVYENVNPPFSIGSLDTVATVSDIVAAGRSDDVAHRFMPAFVYAGTQGFVASVMTTEFYRVYAFTDADCINRVYAGAIVGSPAYAPRPFGSLALPKDTGALSTLRSTYLGDGDQGTTYAEDGEPITPNESLPPPKPTLSLPGIGAPPASGSEPPSSGSNDSGSGSAGSGVPYLTLSGTLGAPVDIWDTNWPQGGYYWTVVPVEAQAPPSITTTVGDPGADIGATSVPVANAAGFAVGDVIEVGNPSNQETVTVRGVTGNVLTLATPLKLAHGTGEPVARVSGNLRYRDLELPQDVCRQGRVMRFGKSSEPTLVTAGAPFASGLSPKGRLVAASAAASSFYGSPLVAWTPALGASAYHVQWSKTRYPFRPVPYGASGAQSEGFLTWGTSAVLPLSPGTWWYRVRGIDFTLPTNAQFMGWSEPARIVLSKPTFTVGRR
jgi:hypothetical protein